MKLVNKDTKLGLIVLLVSAVLVWFACNGCGQPVVYTQPAMVAQPVVAQQQYQIIQDPSTGMQYSVFYDGGVQYMIDIDTWNNWYSLGGFGYVIHHYHSYPRCIRYNSTTYSRYTRVSSGSYNSYKPTFRSSSPSTQFRSAPARTPSGGSPMFRSSAPSSTPTRSAPTFRSSSSGGSRPTFRSSRH